MFFLWFSNIVILFYIFSDLLIGLVVAKILFLPSESVLAFPGIYAIYNFGKNSKIRKPPC